METVTLEKMKQQGHTSNAIEWAKQQYGEYPQRPPKPILSAKHTVDEAEKYVEDFKKFEVVKQKYETQMAEYRNRTNEINNVIVDFIKDEAGLDTVPKQYQDKLYSKAYEEGHSSGYYEVYLKLNIIMETERKIWKLTLSQCCKKPIFSIKDTIGKGFFCADCEKPVYSTIDRKYWNKISKEPKT